MNALKGFVQSLGYVAVALLVALYVAFERRGDRS
jgi:hypothetical protein